jgi:hypothetical protein
MRRIRNFATNDQKLIQASLILSREQYLDTTGVRIRALVFNEKITKRQVFEAMRHFGYRWDGVTWRVHYPEWMIAFQRGDL